MCWTEVPERLRELGGQRNRWHRGLIDPLWRHRRMIGNPRYGAVGLLALPFFVLFEFIGAFVETLGYISVVVSVSLGVVNVAFAIMFAAVAVLSGSCCRWPRCCWMTSRFGATGGCSSSCACWRSASWRTSAIASS